MTANSGQLPDAMGLCRGLPTRLTWARHEFYSGYYVPGLSSTAYPYGVLVGAIAGLGTLGRDGVAAWDNAASTSVGQRKPRTSCNGRSDAIF